MKLNLGCSDRHLPGHVNVDICEPADVVADLNQCWPWEDSSIDEIMAHDIIEHLPNKIFTMNEAWRVLKPGGKFDVLVPTTDGRGAWQDPQHLSMWNRNSMFYYTGGDPHRERFCKAYGIEACFAVMHEEHIFNPNDVVHLHIILEAIK